MSHSRKRLLKRVLTATRSIAVQVLVVIWSVGHAADLTSTSCFLPSTVAFAPLFRLSASLASCPGLVEHRGGGGRDRFQHVDVLVDADAHLRAPHRYPNKWRLRFEPGDDSVMGA